MVLLVALQVLYIKNLHRKASLDDLCAIFGHWQAGTWPKLRLLTGRMGGQAFAHFQGELIQQVLYIQDSMLGGAMTPVCE